LTVALLELTTISMPELWQLLCGDLHSLLQLLQILYFQQKAGLYQETIEVFGHASQWSPHPLLQQQVLGPENHMAEKTSTMDTDLTITITFLVTMLSLFL
jgi:hypothetical protein